MAIVTFHGNPVTTGGDLPALGSIAPEFTLTGRNLEEVKSTAFAGKNKLLLIVPSVDTPICAAAARIFDHKAAQRSETAFLLISADLPFAQDRFCVSEGVQHMFPLSTLRSDFATAYGVKMIDGLLAGLMARAVIVIDASERIIYRELVAEITDEPDYQAALAALDALQQS